MGHDVLTDYIHTIIGYIARQRQRLNKNCGLKVANHCRPFVNQITIHKRCICCNVMND